MQELFRTRSPGRLVAVLANPPLTAGVRTRGRVQLLSSLVGCATTEVVNLFPVPSHSTRDISELGAAVAHWQNARRAIASTLDPGDVVLLAYGVGRPTGSARLHHAEQVTWLLQQLDAMGCPSVIQVGDGPRHPSRWQRWTSRAYPGVPFPEALAASLGRVGLSGRRDSETVDPLPKGVSGSAVAVD